MRGHQQSFLVKLGRRLTSQEKRDRLVRIEARKRIVKLVNDEAARWQAARVAGMRNIKVRVVEGG